MVKIKVMFIDDIAEQIYELHEAMVSIEESGLTQNAIVILLSSLTKESKSTIKNVLWGLENIDRFLK